MDKGDVLSAFRGVCYVVIAEKIVKVGTLITVYVAYWGSISQALALLPSFRGLFHIFIQ